MRDLIHQAQTRWDLWAGALGHLANKLGFLQSMGAAQNSNGAGLCITGLCSGSCTYVVADPSSARCCSSVTIAGFPAGILFRRTMMTRGNRATGRCALGSCIHAPINRPKSRLGTVFGRINFRIKHRKFGQELKSEAAQLVVASERPIVQARTGMASVVSGKHGAHREFRWPPEDGRNRPLTDGTVHGTDAAI